MRREMVRKYVLDNFYLLSSAMCSLAALIAQTIYLNECSRTMTEAAHVVAE